MKRVALNNPPGPPRHETGKHDQLSDSQISRILYFASATVGEQGVKTREGQERLCAGFVDFLTDEGVKDWDGLQNDALKTQFDRFVFVKRLTVSRQMVKAIVDDDGDTLCALFEQEPMGFVEYDVCAPITNFGANANQDPGVPAPPVMSAIWKKHQDPTHRAFDRVYALFMETRHSMKLPRNFFDRDTGWGSTPLHAAIMTSEPALIEKLVLAGADLQKALQHLLDGELRAASFNPGSIDLLVERGAKMSGVVTVDQSTGMTLSYDLMADVIQMISRAVADDEGDEEPRDPIQDPLARYAPFVRIFAAELKTALTSNSVSDTDKAFRLLTGLQHCQTLLDLADESWRPNGIVGSVEASPTWKTIDTEIQSLCKFLTENENYAGAFERVASASINTAILIRQYDEMSTEIGPLGMTSSQIQYLCRSVHASSTAPDRPSIGAFLGSSPSRSGDFLKWIGRKSPHIFVSDQQFADLAELDISRKIDDEYYCFVLHSKLEDITATNRGSDQPGTRAHALLKLEKMMKPPASEADVHALLDANPDLLAPHTFARKWIDVLSGRRGLGSRFFEGRYTADEFAYLLDRADRDLGMVSPMSFAIVADESGIVLSHFCSWIKKAIDEWVQDPTTGAFRKKLDRAAALEILNSGGGKLTPLMCAVASGRIAHAKSLLEAGASANFPFENYTPLMTAIDRRDFQMANLLLDAGACPTVCRSDRNVTYLAYEKRDPGNLDPTYALIGRIVEEAPKALDDAVKRGVSGEMLARAAAQELSTWVSAISMGWGDAPIAPVRLNVISGVMKTLLENSRRDRRAVADGPPSAKFLSAEVRVLSAGRILHPDVVSALAKINEQLQQATSGV